MKIVLSWARLHYFSHSQLELGAWLSSGSHGEGFVLTFISELSISVLWRWQKVDACCRARKIIIIVISERFCGVKYEDTDSKVNILAYTVYLPTSGQDDEFLEILSILSSDIAQHNTNDSVVIIGTDSNVSIKSSRRRCNAMNQFLQSFSLATILKDDKPTFHHNNNQNHKLIIFILLFLTIPM